MGKQTKDPIGHEVSRILTHAADEMGINQPRLAELTGIPQQTISRFFKGQAVSITHAALVSKALGLSHAVVTEQALRNIEAIESRLV